MATVSVLRLGFGGVLGRPVTSPQAISAFHLGFVSWA